MHNGACHSPRRLPQVTLRSLPAGFGDIFPPSATATADALESRVREQARQYSAELRERVASELPQLPFPTLAAAQVRAPQRCTAPRLWGGGLPAASKRAWAAAAAAQFVSHPHLFGHLGGAGAQLLGISDLCAGHRGHFRPQGILGSKQNARLTRRPLLCAPQAALDARNARYLRSNPLSGAQGPSTPLPGGAAAAGGAAGAEAAAAAAAAGQAAGGGGPGGGGDAAQQLANSFEQAEKVAEQVRRGRRRRWFVLGRTLSALVEASWDVFGRRCCPRDLARSLKLLSLTASLLRRASSRCRVRRT